MPSRSESNVRQQSSQNMARGYETSDQQKNSALKKKRMSLQESDLFYRFCNTFLSNGCQEVTDSGLNININIAVEPPSEKDWKAFALADATENGFNDRDVEIRTDNKTKNKRQRVIPKIVRRQSDVTALCSEFVKADSYKSRCKSYADMMSDYHLTEPSFKNSGIRQTSSSSVLSSDISDSYSNEHSSLDGNGCQYESPNHRRRSKAKGEYNSNNEEPYVVVSTEKVRKMSASTYLTINNMKTKADSTKHQEKRHEDVTKLEAVVTDVRQKVRRDSFEISREKQDKHGTHIFQNFRTPRSAIILASAERLSKCEGEFKKATQSSQNMEVKGYLSSLSQEVLTDNIDSLPRPRCQSEPRRKPPQSCCHANRRMSHEYNRTCHNENGETQCSKSVPNVALRPKLISALPLPHMKQRMNLPNGHLDGLAFPLSPMEEVPSPIDKREVNDAETTKFSFENIDYNCETAPQVKRLDKIPPVYPRTGPSDGSHALGSITLKIQYLIITKRLKLTIVKAYGLPQKKIYSTYARACLMPGKHEKQNSDVVKKTNNPEYDSTMYFHNNSLEDMHDKVVRIKIMAKRSKFRRAMPTGEVRIKMDKLDLVSESCLEEDLKPYSPEDENEPPIKWCDTCSVLDTDDFNWD